MARKRKLRAPVKIAPVKIAPKPIKPDPSPLEKEPSSEKEFGANDDADQKLSPTIDDKQQLAVVAPEDVPSQTEPDSKEQPETDLIDDENLRSKRVRQWMIEQQQQKERSDSRAESGESETIENPADDPLEEHGYPMTDEASQLTAASEIPLRHRLKAYTEKEILNSVMYECEWFKCGFETTEDMEYMTHVESHLADYLREQRDSRSIPCLWDLCDFKAGTSSDLESHLHFHAYHNRMKTHGASLSNIIQIPKCNSDSRRRNCIDMYRITFQCEWEDCEEYYNKAQLFFNHTNNHVQDQFPVDKRSRKEPVQCQWAFCKQTYKRASIGLEHIRRHSTERTIGCYTCGAMFVSRLKYIDHCKRQVEYHNREYPCSQCNKLFATKQLMVDHKNIHNKKFACSLCPMMWPSRKALAYHIRYRHVEEKPFKCLVCSHRAVTARDLRIHASIHETDHLKRCKEAGCTAAYKSEISLRKHMSMQHMGLPPDIYACHLCPKEYKSGTGLSRHFMVNHKLDREPGYVRFQYRLDVRDEKYRLTTYLDAELRSDRNADADPADQTVSDVNQSLLSTTIESDTTWTSYSIESCRPIAGDKIAIRMKAGEVFEKEPKKPRRSDKSRNTKRIRKKKLSRMIAGISNTTKLNKLVKIRSPLSTSVDDAELIIPDVIEQVPTVATVQKDASKSAEAQDIIATTDNFEKSLEKESVKNNPVSFPKEQPNRTKQQSSPRKQQSMTDVSELYDVPSPEPFSNDPVTVRNEDCEAEPQNSEDTTQNSEEDLVTETVGEFTITMSRTDKSRENDDNTDEPVQVQPDEAIDCKELVKEEIVELNSIELVKQYLKPDCSVVISIDETDEAGNVLQNTTIDAVQYSCNEDVDLDFKPIREAEN
ncbi:uncharacterized protein LOC129726684 isoform X1 [Wyeomyia smithii]|uniref:uncharacterized protein LOC129726684 isoform X1 n=1 Tax=Wyeomyia smithii TaxID=174621 RepID=UPI0024680538|nr:uncharacterized protein LOC129726684 isoform X1 [Wyeomyia smithii]